MTFTVAIIAISILVVAIWLIVEFKRFRHKFFALLLIGLILFLYFSITSVFSGTDVDYKSFSGLTKATKIYFSWFGSTFGNIKTITGNAINMDWKNINKSSEE
ncbi:MAG TPA: hypothetical protein VJH65_01070 [Candidatus Nanoarchaeia archaeon]|nr:hypothetical protein [Candidatus Nanoarchaeia archaeon]